jgi:hypothetical protein
MVLLMLSIAVSACSMIQGSDPVGPAPKGGSAASADFGGRTAADLRLARFGTDNPECPLWTNWRKICSRTGANGATVCSVDRERPVRSSEPFCVATPFSGKSGSFSEKQRLSSLRFCAATRQEHVTDGSGATLYREVVCARYRVDRPFNGRGIAARRHPLCKSWSSTREGLLFCGEWIPGPCRLQDGYVRPRVSYGPDEIWIPRTYDPEAISAYGVFCP